MCLGSVQTLYSCAIAWRETYIKEEQDLVHLNFKVLYNDENSILFTYGNTILFNYNF